MELSVPLADGRAACSDSIDALVAAVDSLSEYDLLDVSRCHGWTRLDVAVHVLAGWQEMLGGLASPTVGEPTVDAASYWPAFARDSGTDDPVTVLMAQRRRTAAYARPESAREQLRDVAAALRRGIGACHEGEYFWQGQVFTAGDFLAIWAVEDVIHHLDLRCAEPAPSTALALARATVEALAGPVFPESMTDEDVVLVGSGRSSVPAGMNASATRWPVVG